jgi:hypothetical protein
MINKTESYKNTPHNITKFLNYSIIQFMLNNLYSFMHINIHKNPEDNIGKHQQTTSDDEILDAFTVSIVIKYFSVISILEKLSKLILFIFFGRKSCSII